MHRTAWKEAWRTITGSWARFFSIAALMFLGAFALVGLKVTGPDMRETGAAFFDETNLADVTVTSPMGVNEDALASVDGATAEFGYAADATVEDSLTTLHLMSTPEEISTFSLTAGSMPSGSDEIALTSELEGSYNVGDTVVFNDDDESPLATRSFTVTGFVRSAEYLDREDIGQTTLGTGQLDGFAAVAPEAFESPVYTMARLRFAETAGFEPYADSYLARLDEYQDAVEAALDNEADSPYEVQDRRDFQGYLTYGDSADRIDAISQVFPVFLFAIASLVSLTTMTRMVQEQRTTNGTFAALGYSPRAIRRKYLLYGISASTLGGLIGVGVGHTLLPTVIFNAYQEIFSFPALQLGFYPLISVTAVAIAIICTVLVAAIVATRELNEVPSQLLLPKPPAAGTRIFLERIRPLWRRMSFTQKITARNLFRYKRRMFMTVFGVAGCTALLILAFGVLDSITGVVNRQFNQIVHYDLIAVAAQQPEDEVESVDGVEDATSVRFEQMSVRLDGESIDQEIRSYFRTPMAKTSRWRWPALRRCMPGTTCLEQVPRRRTRT